MFWIVLTTKLLFTGMRKPYHGEDAVFDVKHLVSLDPMKQFKAWFDDICKEKAVDEPNAMAVASCTK